MKQIQQFRLKAASVAVAMCFATPMAWANPTGATVVNGAATFASSGNTLTVTNTPGAILNWQQFNIGKGQTTQFIQQSAQSSVLNRVLSNQPSQILGTLRSNGQVFLINQAGIMFGVGSVVDVNGLIASTLNISNADFLLNRLNFNGTAGTSVLNQGTITTPLGGRVYLIGNNVTNQGVITTAQGQVILAAGNSVSLVDTTTPHISVTLSAPAGGQTVNLGQINAAGGSIDVYATLIQQQGVMRADSASVNAQGRVVLSATGSTTVSGQVSATGAGQGGTIKVLGNQVTLTNTAQVDASGATGGGTVLVGGDFQGKNAAVQNAAVTTIAQGATIKADALDAGNGGKVVVWANDTTQFAGNISARGGVNGGNGGNTEVSGKRTLAFKGGVDTRAPKGKTGTTLLDPMSYCIVDGAAWASCPNVLAPSTLGVGTTGWTVQTTDGNITVIDPIYLNASSGNLLNGNTLTLDAVGGSILTLSAAQAQSWKMSQALANGGTVATPPLGGQIFTFGANLIFKATQAGATGMTPGEIHIANGISTNGGSVTMMADSFVTVDGGGKPIVLTPIGATTQTSYMGGIYTSGGAVNVQASDFTLGGNQLVGGVVPSNIDTTVRNLLTSVAIIDPLTKLATGGAVNINVVGASRTSKILLETGSNIFAGSGNVSLSGMSYGNSAGTGVSATIDTSGQTLFKFDYIDTSRLKVNSGSLAFVPFTSTKSVFVGLALSDPNCTTGLCLFSGAVGPMGSSIWAKTKGMAIGSAGNITLSGNSIVDSGNAQYTLLAFNDIVFNANSSLSATTPTTGSPGTRLNMIAFNNFTNNAGANAIGMPWSLFTKDQNMAKLGGLTSTVLSLGQSVPQFTLGSALSSLNAGTNTALEQILSGFISGGGVVPNTPAAGNLALFWGNSAVTPKPLPLDFVAQNNTVLGNTQANCTLNPALCNNLRANTSASTVFNTASILKPTVNAVGDLTYSASLGATGNMVLISYHDVRMARQDARRTDEDAEHAEERVLQARNLSEKNNAQREVETQFALVRTKRAEAKVRETEMELRAADVEMQAARSPEDRMRAEIRQTVAASRRADAEVQKSDASFHQAEIELKHAQTPAAKAAAEVKKADADMRRAFANVNKAEVDADKAKIEAAHARVNHNTQSGIAVKQAEVEVKKAAIEVKRAEAEMKAAKDPAVRERAAMKVAVAVAKQAAAEVEKANAELNQSDESAKALGTPLVQHIAETKRVDAEAKQAYADVKSAEVEVNHIKDPVVRVRAEEKLAQAELKKAEVDVKVAEIAAKSKGSEVAKAVVVAKKALAEEKKAELVLKAEKDPHQKTDAALKLADARMRKVEAEEKQAVEEARETREGIKSVRSEESKAVLLKKAEASEARSVAKHVELEAKQAEAAVKRSEAELKQAEADAKQAKSPEQRLALEKRLDDKRMALESKRGDADRKLQLADLAADEADSKEELYHEAKGRRDERVLEAFGGVDVSGMGRKRVQEMMTVRHEFLREKLGAALKMLLANGRAADLKKCQGDRSGACIRTEPVGGQSLDVLARVKLPLPSPITAFLPEIERKIAVVIGNNAYQDPDIPALNGAVRDADAVGKMLKEKLGYDVRMVHNGTREDIVRTLNLVADETGSKDSVVVYYAGHGYEMEDTKEGYWIPSDGLTSSPENWISNTDINSMLSHIPAKQMMVVSDSCFSGSLTNQSKVTSAMTSVETPAAILGKRSVLVMSSGGEEPVMDEGRDGHSIFAWHLLDKVNKLDSYEHGAEVFDAIKAGVNKDGIPQTPQYGASVSAGHSVGGDYLFEVRKY